ncbi:DUF1561 family protein [Helicobacter pametensis]|uniref:DUF1561 family protein n=1 Tax=Helicobacter pametensis TaxID=95149 RepID=UPI000480A537|nr:DUF1561 family protein [Helicobacter pametensis]
MRKVVLFFGFIYGLFGAQPSSVVQVRADQVLDGKVLVQANGGKPDCLAVRKIDGETFVGLASCDSNALVGRYDVYKRIGVRVQGKWMCFSLRPGLTSGRGSIDHIVLRPCVLNDDTQWFTIQNGLMRLEKYPNIQVNVARGLIVATSKQPVASFNLFDPVMKDWYKTLAKPINYALKTSMMFKILENKTLKDYYLTPNGMSAEETFIYHDPQEGTLFDFVDGKRICLSSKLNNKDVSFISWADCDSAVLPSMRWNFDQMQGGYIYDERGNILDVARGQSRGTPMVSTRRAFKQYANTGFGFWGNFFFDSKMDDLHNFIAKNSSFQAQTCGLEKRRVKRDGSNQSLADFDPKKGGWRSRLYHIAITSDSSAARAGVCGICMIQSYEILALLTQVFPHTQVIDPGNVGYFFNYAQGTNPFISLETRSPSINRVLFSALNYWGDAFNPDLTLYMRSVRALQGVTNYILPQSRWNLRTSVFDASSIEDEIKYILNSPPGSLFIALINQEDEPNFSGHAVPIVRTRAGVIVIPTNVPSATLTEFGTFIEPRTTLEALAMGLTNNGSYRIAALTLLERGESNPNLLENLMEQNDCSGEGSNRRGNGMEVDPDHANACGSEHCSLMEWE